MYVDVDIAASTTTLRESEDFKRFSLKVGASADAERIAATLASCKAGRMLGDGAEIDILWLLANGPLTEDWVQGFEQMVTYAATKGWVDAERTIIRAHIEKY